MSIIPDKVFKHCIGFHSCGDDYDIGDYYYHVIYRLDEKEWIVSRNTKEHPKRPRKIVERFSGILFVYKYLENLIEDLEKTNKQEERKDYEQKEKS